VSRKYVYSYHILGQREAIFLYNRNLITCIFCIFLAWLGLELKVLCLLVKHFTTWAMPPALFSLIIFEIESHFLPRPVILLFYTSHCHWDDRHVTIPSFLLLLLLRWRLLNFFFFFFCAGMELRSPNLSLLYSLWWQVHATVLSYLLRDGVLLPWTTILILASPVAKNTGVSHWYPADILHF
jgi:hypothetical protein